jgi:hypothetical protein
MFSFFKRKPRQNEFVAMLELDTPAYTRVVTELFEAMDPATRAHVLVAYENLLPVLSVLWSEGKKQGEEFTVEQFTREAARALDAATGDEINSRRWAWFLFATLLGRLEKLSRNDPGTADSGARIWCDIADASPRLKNLLPDNVIWRTDEKAWFDLSMPDDKLIEWTVNYAMPPMFSKLPQVQSFARSRGLFYLPSKT